MPVDYGWNAFVYPKTSQILRSPDWPKVILSSNGNKAKIQAMDISFGKFNEISNGNSIVKLTGLFVPNKSGLYVFGLVPYVSIDGTVRLETNNSGYAKSFISKQFAAIAVNDNYINVGRLNTSVYVTGNIPNVVTNYQSGVSSNLAVAEFQLEAGKQYVISYLIGGEGNIAFNKEDNISGMVSKLVPLIKTPDDSGLRTLSKSEIFNKLQ